jgi:uracil-DNA glycosylase
LLRVAASWVPRVARHEWLEEWEGELWALDRRATGRFGLLRFAWGGVGDAARESILDHGELTGWADRGVMLLNTVLTVRAHEPNSHRKKGWETFTDRVIEALAARQDPLVFMLWGKPAQAKVPLIERHGGRHEIILSAHPSPLSAKSGFFGSQPFSKVNAALSRWDKAPIDWRLS